MTGAWDPKAGWRILRDTHGTVLAVLLKALLIALLMLPAAVPLLLMALVTGLLVRHRRSLRFRTTGMWTTPGPYAMLYFLLHALGMFWTEDLAFGAFDLQIKAPLLVLPLLGMLLPMPARRGREVLFMGLGLASAGAVLLCLAGASILLIVDPTVAPAEAFFSSRFSRFLHPSYFAMYLCTALAGWYLTPVHSLPSALIKHVVPALAVVGIILCGSKMGWAVMAVMLPMAMAVRWREKALRRTLGLALVGALLGVSTLVVVSPNARSRVQEAWQAAMAPGTTSDASTSSAVRRITWSTAWALFKQDPLKGTGTGDVKNELMRSYREHGQEWVLEHRLNAHSQFLQSAACLGVSGSLALLLMGFAPFFGRLRKDPFIVAFMLLSVGNWTVESMLEVQAGVVFFTLILLLMDWTTVPSEERSSQPCAQ